MIAATAPQPQPIDVEQVQRDLEWCRQRGDVLSGQRLQLVLDLLEGSEALKRKAGEVLKTLQPAEGPANRLGRSGGRCRL